MKGLDIEETIQIRNGVYIVVKGNGVTVEETIKWDTFRKLNKEKSKEIIGEQVYNMAVKCLSERQLNWKNDK